jgi:hypothetical protein
VKLFQVGYKMTANISPDTLDKEMMHMIGKKEKGKSKKMGTGSRNSYFLGCYQSEDDRFPAWLVLLAQAYQTESAIQCVTWCSSFL